MVSMIMRKADCINRIHAPDNLIVIREKTCEKIFLFHDGIPFTGSLSLVGGGGPDMFDESRTSPNTVCHILVGLIFRRPVRSAEVIELACLVKVSVDQLENFVHGAERRGVSTGFGTDHNTLSLAIVRIFPTVAIIAEKTRIGVSTHCKSLCLVEKHVSLHSLLIGGGGGYGLYEIVGKIDEVIVIHPWQNSHVGTGIVHIRPCTQSWKGRPQPGTEISTGAFTTVHIYVGLPDILVDGQLSILHIHRFIDTAYERFGHGRILKLTF